MGCFLIGHTLNLVGFTLTGQGADFTPVGVRVLIGRLVRALMSCVFEMPGHKLSRVGRTKKCISANQSISRAFAALPYMAAALILLLVLFLAGDVRKSLVLSVSVIIYGESSLPGGEGLLLL